MARVTKIICDCCGKEAFDISDPTEDIGVGSIDFRVGSFRVGSLSSNPGHSYGADLCGLCALKVLQHFVEKQLANGMDDQVRIINNLKRIITAPIWVKKS
jgi:hypothetical protein